MLGPASIRKDISFVQENQFVQEDSALVQQFPGFKMEKVEGRSGLDCLLSSKLPVSLFFLKSKEWEEKQQ